MRRLKSTKQTSHPDKASLRRGIVVMAFSLMPLMIPVAIYASLVVVTDIEHQRSIGAETEYAAITYPVKGKTVQNSFTAKGVVKSVPDGYYAYISTGSDNLLWPKFAVAEGNWSMDMTATGEQGYQYNIVVMVVKQEGKNKIESWFKRGKESGKYPPLTEIADMHTLATVRVEK